MRPALLFAARVLPVALSLAGCHPSGSADYTGFIGCGTVIPSKVQVSGMGNRGVWTLPGGHILPAYYSAYDASQCERMGLQGRDARDCWLSDVETPFEIYKPRASDTLIVVKGDREFYFQIRNDVCQAQGSAPSAVTVSMPRTYVAGEEVFFEIYNGSSDTLDASLCGAVFERARGRVWSSYASVRCESSLGTRATVAPRRDAELLLAGPPVSDFVPGKYRARILLSRTDGTQLPESTRTSTPFDVIPYGGE